MICKRTLHLILLSLFGVFSIMLYAVESGSQNCKGLVGEGKGIAQQEVSFADKWSFVGAAIEEEGYEIWGSSPIRDEEGKVHLFAARWPHVSKHEGWTSESEIAHYMADSPEGPFKFIDVVLKGTQHDTWDKYAPHNPTIHKVDDNYVLLYIANSDYHKPFHPSNQKIGMAISKSLNGPWKKVGVDGCILKPSEDSSFWNYKAWNGVNNPAFLKNPKGGYMMYFKSGGPKVGFAQMGVAFSDKLEGPWKMYNHPVTKNNVTIEDGYAFIYKDEICLLTTDNHGIIQEGCGLIWSSEDGINFTSYEKGFHRPEKYIPKEIISKAKLLKGAYAKFERPQVLLINGKVSYLYVPCTANMNGKESTASYILKFNE